jgi:caa(3)-type oxidase subunit IV
MSDSKDHGKQVAPAATHETASAAGHGEHGNLAHDMHLKLYLGIGITLLVFTFITVALAYVDFGSHARNFVIAMIVATFKVCLVGAVFMHLKGEKPTIWRFLYFTLFFVLGLFLLTLLAHSDPIFGTTLNQH